MTRTQLADSHLTYISAGLGKYDVYPPHRGSQLGTVTRGNGVWIARDLNGNERVSAARWRAAVALWGSA